MASPQNCQFSVYISHHLDELSKINSCMIIIRIMFFLHQKQVNMFPYTEGLPYQNQNHAWLPYWISFARHQHQKYFLEIIHTKAVFIHFRSTKRFLSFQPLPLHLFETLYFDWYLIKQQCTSLPKQMSFLAFWFIEKIIIPEWWWRNVTAQQTTKLQYTERQSPKILLL